MHQQEIRYVPAGAPRHERLQQERLRSDRHHVTVEVGQQQPG